jgi:glycosyltransferase involved in cell wall biosynthesis
MRLLIATQTVDTEDPVLGFFVRWIEEFSKQVEHIEVICLREGEHSLPSNVRVHSLGKENGSVNRMTYALRFLTLAWKLRSEYDVVFVHMNQEYILISGWLFRLLGKRVYFWRNHVQGNIWTRLSVFLSHTVLYTSPHSFTARFRKAIQMPIGIDTDFFKSDPLVVKKTNSILFLGRLDPVKKVEEFIRAMQSVDGVADIYGDPTPGNEAYAREVMDRAVPLVTAGKIVFHHGVSHQETLGLYNAHSIYANLTPSGSFDKTIGEAMASGCVVVCANDAMRGVVREELLVKDDEPQDAARAILAALRLSPHERAAEEQKLRAYVMQHHSLSLLIDNLLAV